MTSSWYWYDINNGSVQFNNRAGETFLHCNTSEITNSKAWYKNAVIWDVSVQPKQNRTELKNRTQDREFCSLDNPSKWELAHLLTPDLTFPIMIDGIEREVPHPWFHLCPSPTTPLLLCWNGLSISCWGLLSSKWLSADHGYKQVQHHTFELNM